MVNSILLVIFAAFLVISTNAFQVEQVHSSDSDFLEGPHWDVDTQSLYYVQMYAKIVRYDYPSKQVFSATIDYVTYVTFIIPIEGTNDQFAIGLGRRVGLIQWDGKSSKATFLRILVEVEPEPRFYENSLNDAKADPKGRFFGGTFGVVYNDVSKNNFGSLYSGYLSEGALQRIKKYICVSNGLTWNKEADTFYYIDTCSSNIKAYNYSINTGEITNERIVISFYEFNKELKYKPDGMTIDTNGNLYVATFLEPNILKINPSTKEVVVIDMPVACKTTSVSFGGPNLDILYVTSGGNENNPKLPGILFQITGLAQGSPATKLKLY